MGSVLIRSGSTEELRAIFGHDIKPHLRSPKTFAKEVENWKYGLRLEIEWLRLSRYQEQKPSWTSKSWWRSPFKSVLSRARRDVDQTRTV